MEDYYDNFSSWSDIEEIEPDKTDLDMLNEIETNPDVKHSFHPMKQ